MVASTARKGTSNRKEETEVLRFMTKKIKSYMPYWLIFWLMDFFVRYGAKDIREIISRFLYSLWSLGFLNMAGMGQSVLGVGWYIQSMLLIMFLLYPICLKNWKKYCEIAAPLFAIAIIGFFAQRYHTLSRVSQWLKIFYTGTLRLFGSMNLGGVSYFISTKLRKLTLTKAEKIGITIIENIGLVITIFIINYRWQSAYDFLILFIFFLCITLQFSEISYSNKIFTVQWLRRAGENSFIIYLASGVITDILTQKKWKFGYWRMTAIYVSMTILLAFTVKFIWKWIRRRRMI